jgi:SAM-dependent methyltransferase
MTLVLDAVNRSAMQSSAVIVDYGVLESLTPPERVAIARAWAALGGGAILDLGVGAGRTTPHLRALSPDYTGIDYSQEMIVACRRKFPDARLLHMDARDMSAFADGQFALAVFSCNGLGMVDHEGRMRILREVHRVLRPGGYFVMNSHNQHSPDYSDGMVLPNFQFHRGEGVASVARHFASFMWHTAMRVRHYWRYSRHDFRTPEYSIINDRCHDYAVMLYYISLEHQRAQLASVGFRSDVEAYDLDGLPIPAGSDCTDSSILYLARK